MYKIFRRWSRLVGCTPTYTSSLIDAWLSDLLIYLSDLSWIYYEIIIQQNSSGDPTLVRYASPIYTVLYINSAGAHYSAVEIACHDFTGLK